MLKLEVLRNQVLTEAYGKVKERQRQLGRGWNAFNCSIEVANIDETTAKITAAGGLVVRDKAQIPGVGWLAMYVDTEGNTFGVMQR